MSTEPVPFSPPGPPLSAARARRIAGFAPQLDALYDRFNCKPAATPDPIRFVLPFTEVADREIAGMVCALLAYGGLPVILASCERALAPMGPRPSAWLDARPSRASIARPMEGFRHRWTRAHHLADLLWAVRALRRRYGSLDAAFACVRRGHTSLRPAAAAFAAEFFAVSPPLADGRFLPDPARGSACKRLMLFFRWMVRHDRVDPGGWTSLSPAELVLPLDVHTFRAARRLGLTRRRTPDYAAAAEATAALASIRPDDPVRYDFALAHCGDDLPNA